MYSAGATPATTAKRYNLYRPNATENKTGLEFMIKVMVFAVAGVPSESPLQV